MSAILIQTKQALKDIENGVKWANSSDLIHAYPAWLDHFITTIESLQGELKAADDHEETLKHAFHVRQNINEKELYDKDKIIESLQKDNERWNSLRPEVQWFAEQMGSRLKKNDHKSGWKDTGTIHLLNSLRQETNELEGVVYFNEGEIDIISEAADVANFAMMIADVSRIQEGESHE